MNIQELIKLLKKNGCKLDYHGKRHDMWYSKKRGKYFRFQDIKQKLQQVL